MGILPKSTPKQSDLQTLRRYWWYSMALTPISTPLGIPSPAHLELLAVHVYGKARCIEGEELLHHLKSLVDHYEEGRPNRVQVETMSPSYLEGQIRAILGFEIEVKEVHASAKLSQNRDDENYGRVVKQLEQSSIPGDLEVAEEMRKRRQTVDR